MSIMGNAYNSVPAKKKIVSDTDEKDTRKKYINCFNHFDPVSIFNIKKSRSHSRRLAMALMSSASCVAKCWEYSKKWWVEFKRQKPSKHPLMGCCHFCRKMIMSAGSIGRNNVTQERPVVKPVDTININIELVEPVFHREKGLWGGSDRY
jgi:hypothetical protein